MPKMIEIYEVDYFKLRKPETKIDPEIKGFLGFAYPGCFVAVGETRDEALQLCKMRLRAARLKHQKDWAHYSSHREEMIEKLFHEKGITRAHVWEEEDISVDRDLSNKEQN